MQSNVSLKDYTTMHLGGPARALATATTPDDIVSYANQAEAEGIPLLILGAGSNVIVSDNGFDGLVVLNRIPGFEIIEDNPMFAVVKAGGGMAWDDLVQKTVDLNLSGVENLSAIPGYVGAAPIQNIGAYGQEIANTLLEVEAYDTKQKKVVTLSNSDCDFTYRRSIFNSSARGRYIITSITLQLSKKPLEPPFYDSLQQYLDTHHVSDYSPDSLRQAVRSIRATKLPDPRLLPNTGSFFKNPLLEKWQADELTKKYPDAPLFPMSEDMFKLSAGWLIESAGLKGLEMNGMKVYDKNALVLVNENASSYQQLSEMREHIIESVQSKFQIILTQEPEEIGA